MWYLGLTLCTFLPLLLGYFMHKAELSEDLVAVVVFFGFLAMIYWSLITSAIFIYGIKKYIEIGNMQIFIEKIFNR